VVGALLAVQAVTVRLIPEVVVQAVLTLVQVLMAAQADQAS
jgi:hypothetical protein